MDFEKCTMDFNGCATVTKHFSCISGLIFIDDKLHVLKNIKAY